MEITIALILIAIYVGVSAVNPYFSYTLIAVIALFIYFRKIAQRVDDPFDAAPPHPEVIDNQFCSKEVKEKYMKSDRWKQLKLLRLEIAGHKCEYCRAAINLQLHHQSYVKLLEEDIDDVRILCGDYKTYKGCHSKLHEITGYSRGATHYITELER